MIVPAKLPQDGRTFSFLSHFHPASIELDGEAWRTVEHYHQAQKSDHPGYHAAISAVTSPGIAKRLAAHPAAPRRISQQSWFRKHGAFPRADWHDVKLDPMRRADLAKFTQHAELAALLLATGEATLIEDSPGEPYWGTGPDGNGHNWAGRVLMEIRHEIRKRLRVYGA